MPRKMLAAMLLGAAMLSGCAARQNAEPSRGQLIAECLPGKEVETANAPYKATYVLHHWPAPPSEPPPSPPRSAGR